MIIIEIIFILAWLCHMLSSNGQLIKIANIVEVATVIFFICYSSAATLFVVLLVLNALLLIWQIVRDIRKTKKQRS